MNERIDKLWLQYISGDELTDRQLQELAQEIETDKSTRRRVADERAVDSLLQLMARQKDERFVEESVARFSELVRQDRAINAPPAATVTATMDQQPPQVSSGVSSVEEPIAIAFEPSGGPARAPNSRPSNAKRRVIAGLTIAASLLLLASAAIVFSNPRPNQQTGDRPSTRETGEPAIGSLDQAARQLDQAQQALEERWNRGPDRLSNSRQPDRTPAIDSVVQSKAGNSLENPAQQPGNQSEEISADAAHFAMLVESDACVWDNRPEKPRLGPAQLVLLRGRAHLQFDDGPSIELLGPAELEVRSRDEVLVKQGRFLAQVPADASRFVIRSPSSQFDNARQLSMQMNVAEDGATEVLVDQGDVDLRCWQKPNNLEAFPGQPVLARRWRLNDGTMNQALVGSQRADSGPAVSMARSATGDFVGLVDVGGDALEVTSFDALSQLMQRATEGFERSPDEFMSQWKELMRQFGSDQFNGTIEVNGQSTPLRSFNDLFRSPQEMLENMLGGFGGGSFQGVMNINGREQRFDSLEDFQKARSQLFGPLMNMEQMIPDNRSANSSSAFQGVINVNGSRFEFTSPEEFRQAMGQRR